MLAFATAAPDTWLQVSLDVRRKIVISSFESVAQWLKPRRKNILLGALIGFGILVVNVVLGGPMPGVVMFVVLMLSWWLWLSLMLINLFQQHVSDSDELAHLVMSFPGFRHFFLIILIIMAASPLVWFVSRYT